MSALLGIDGLATGLDTTSIINSLMQIEAGPQTLLKSKQTAASATVTALQGINVRLASLAASAETAAKASNWTSFTATSNTTSVAVTAGSTATAGSITFSVDQVATKQISLTSTVTDGSQLTADNPPTLSVKKADGTIVSFTAASNSLSDIAAAINGAGAGVSATAVRVNSGTTPEYRLQFTSTKTGTEGAFEVYVGDEAAVTGLTASRLDTATASTAVDATLTLWKGSAYEQAFTQSSNVFTGLMTGVDVTVSKATDVGETATVSVAPDSSKVKSLASNLVNSLSTVLADMTSRTKVSSSVGSDGSTTVKGAILTGDSGITSARSAVTQAAIYPVNGKSPSTVGIIVAKDGTISFDEAIFSAAVQSDPAGTAAFVQALATRVQTAAESYSDPYSGSLTARITSQQSAVSDLASQVEAWDTRLEMRRSTLQATYSALEVTMSNLNAQSSWLTSQINSLSTSYSG